jgi:hypothetical protein
MDCRHFREQHLAYLDDTLPGDVMREAQQHLLGCEACAAHDMRLRRSLMLAHNHLPELEPSSDFRARLDARLAECAAERRAASHDAGLVVEDDPFVMAPLPETDAVWRSRTAWLAMAASVAVVSVASLARSNAVAAEPELPPVFATAPRPPAVRLSTPRASAPAMLPVVAPAGPLWSQPAGHDGASAAVFLRVGVHERSMFAR